MRMLVLGGGRIGRVIALDLASDHDVTLVDSRTIDGLPNVEFLKRDIASLDLPAFCRDYDVVVGALPSALGYATLQQVIESGRPYCDISFMPEDARALSARARERGVCAVYDCGVAPGMSNLLAARGCSLMDTPQTVRIYVGGLPKTRRWPFQYKAGFAPFDVIEEYTRPARLKINGEIVVREALSEIELLDFDDVGTLEAFNTDGLRSLIETLPAPTVLEKTMRYPGHTELMRVLRDVGLFDTDPIAVGEAKVSPRDMLAELLFERWTFQPGEADLTVMRVMVEGTHLGKPASHRWDLHDRYDPQTGFTSMSRTTGFPAAIVARLLASKALKTPGVHPPEALAEMGVFDTLIEDLKKRGVDYIKR
jgi:lysine 6-dehydrogenase